MDSGSLQIGEDRSLVRYGHVMALVGDVHVASAYRNPVARLDSECVVRLVGRIMCAYNFWFNLS